jgi:hypothetical protein
MYCIVPRQAEAYLVVWETLLDDLRVWEFEK